MPDSGRTALYRYFRADGKPLYIGITNHLEDRKKAHAATHWAREVSAFTVEWFEVEAEAAAAETAAIRSEAPLYNVRDNFEHVPFPQEWPSLASAGRRKAVELAALMRAEIDSGKWPVGHKIPSPKEMAAAAEIGMGAVNHAIQMLQGEHIIYRFRSFGYFVSED